MAWLARRIAADQALLQRQGDGRLAAVDAQLGVGVLEVEVDGAFSDAQDDADFPAGLAMGSPVQAGLLA